LATAGSAASLIFQILINVHRPKAGRFHEDDLREEMRKLVRELLAEELEEERANSRAKITLPTSSSGLIVMPLAPFTPGDAALDAGNGVHI
jgi:hypothetical protein